jgi:type IV pilus assembly protein PilV
MSKFQNLQRRASSRGLVRQRGSFILEALISLAIFSIALIGTLALVASSLNQLGQTKARNDASYLAGELIADMWVSATVDIPTWVTRVQLLVPGATANVYFETCDCATASGATGACTAGNLKTLATAVASPQPVTICMSWTDKKDTSYPRRYQTSTVISRN